MPIKYTSDTARLIGQGHLMTSTTVALLAGVSTRTVRMYRPILQEDEMVHPVHRKLYLFDPSVVAFFITRSGRRGRPYRSRKQIYQDWKTGHQKT